MPNQTKYETPGEEVVEEENNLSDEKVLELVKKPLETAEKWMKSYSDIWERLDRLYQGKVSKSSDVHVLPTQHSSGEAFQLIETMFPRMSSARIRASVKGVEKDDDVPARRAEFTLNHQIEQDDLDEPLKDGIKQSLKTIGAIKIDYNLEDMVTFKKKRKYEMKLPGINKTVGMGKMKTVEEVHQKFTHEIETIPWEDLILPECRDFNKGPFVAFKTSKIVREMKDDERYQNIDKLVKEMGEQERTRSEYELEKKDQKDLDTLTYNDFLLEQEIDVIEVYFRYEGRMYVANIPYEFREVVVRNEELKSWHRLYPLQVLSLIGQEDEAIGRSPLQAAEPDIDVQDLWLNLMLGVGLFDIARPTLYDPNKTGINWQKNPPVYKPGANYPVNDLNAWKVMDVPKVDRTHLEIWGLLKQTFQNKLGVTDYISGSGQMGEDKTLGEVQLKTAQSIKRFEPQVNRIRKWLKRIFYILNSNNQQFMPDTYPIRISGEKGNEWVTQKAEAIQGRFDFEIEGFEDIFVSDAEVINKYRAMISDALKFPQMVNIPELVRRLYVDGYKVRDPENVVIPVQETLQEDDRGKKQEAEKANAENQTPSRAAVRPDDDHKVHLDVHLSFLKSPAGQQLPKGDQMALARHIDAHRKVLHTDMKGKEGAPQSKIDTPAPIGMGQMVRPRDKKVSYNRSPMGDDNA